MRATREFFGACWRARKLLLKAFREWVADRCDGLAGALAFHGGLAAAPFLTLLLWVLMSTLGEGWTRQHVSPVLAYWLGRQRVAGLEGLLAVAHGVPLSEVAGLTLAGAAAMVLGAVGFFLMLQDSLQTVWDVRREVPGFRAQMLKRLKALLYMAVSGAIVIGGLLVGSLVAWALGGEHNERGPAAAARRVLLGATGYAIVWALVSLWFRLLIPVRLARRDIAIWASVVAALHVVGRQILMWRFGSAELDVAGAIILTILWLYYTMLVFLYGAELMRVHLRDRTTTLVRKA